MKSRLQITLKTIFILVSFRSSLHLRWRVLEVRVEERQRSLPGIPRSFGMVDWALIVEERVSGARIDLDVMRYTGLFQNWLQPPRCIRGEILSRITPHSLTLRGFKRPGREEHKPSRRQQDDPSASVPRLAQFLCLARFGQGKACTDDRRELFCFKQF
jgi:hypothetical protein